MNLEDILQDLKKEYLAALPDRIESIRKLSLEDSTDSLREAFHKLKGTGKTYGFPEVSQVAEVGEMICRDKAKSIPQALPSLLGLMTDIHKARCQEKALDVDNDPRFLQIKELSQSLRT